MISLGLNLWSTTILARGGGGEAPFSPASLFASGEEGAWYEPSTTTTFTDLEGYTFATYGQPVAHLIDKSQGATIEARRNLFTDTEELAEFSSVQNGAVVRADGWAEFTENTSASSFHRLFDAGFSLSAVTYELSLDFEYVDCQFIHLVAYISTNNEWASIRIDLINKEVVATDVGGSTSIVSSGVEPLDGNICRANMVFDAGASGTWLFNVFTASSTSGFSTVGSPVSFTGTSRKVKCRKSQIAVGSTATAYQKITTGQTVSWLPGNHATQTTLASRPILARVPETGRRNQLERTEEFDDAVWILDNSGATNPVVTADQGLDPNGDLTADRIQLNKTGGTFSRIRQDFTATPLPNAIYTFSAWMKTYSGSGTQNVGLRIFSTDSNHVVTGEWQRFSVTVSAATTTPNSSVLLIDGAGNDETADILVWGAQLDAGSTATDYQKVVTSYDITEAGVTSLEYLSFDGANDGMVTAPIEAGTDKAQVLAGIARIGTVQYPIVMEFGGSANGYAGSFSWTQNTNVSNRMFVSTYDSPSVATTATISTDYPPNTVVMVAEIDRAASTEISARINGSEAGISLSGSGSSGNFGTLPMYIGSRGLTGSFFNGEMYALVFRFGPILTTGEITNTEAYLATRSGVTLP